MKKQKIVILDSSVWLSSFLQDNTNHLEAQKIIKNCFKTKLIYVPDIVFFEVISVLVKLQKYQLAKDFSSLDFSITKLSNKDFLNFIFTYRNSFKTKTHDSLIIIHCLVHNTDCFITFDKQQQINYNLIKYNL